MQQTKKTSQKETQKMTWERTGMALKKRRPKRMAQEKPHPLYPLISRLHA